VSSLVAVGTQPRSQFFSRVLSPLQATLSAWCTSRSIMEAATTSSSPNTSPQWPYCLLVTISEAHS
jgi:hypothetical protein